MDVSVIFVNYRTSGLIAESIRSIIRHTEGVSYEIIIVDNNSEPEFQSNIQNSLSIDKPLDIRYLALPENIGFGRANNKGWEISKGRNIFFLNPDTLLLNNAIKLLSDFLDRHPKAGACGGNLYGTDLQPAFSFSRILPGLKWELNELLNYIPQKISFGKDSHFNTSTKTLPVKYITGADLMVKRTVLNITGGFSSDFFLYYEETDLCYRILNVGYKIFNIPEAKIQHLESKSMEESGEFQSDFKTKYLEKSRKIYYSRNVGSFRQILSDAIYLAFLKSRALLIRDKRKKEYYNARIKYFNDK